MKMKKLLCMILAIGMFCAAAACGGDSGNPSGNSESSSVVDGGNSESISEEDLPLGAEGNPHWCYYNLDDTGEIIGTSMYVPTIKANSAEYYQISKSGDKVVCIEQADVTVIYKGTSYSAKDGAIEIQCQPAVAGDLNDWAIFQIINATSSDIELIMNFKGSGTVEGDETTSDETASDETASDETASDTTSSEVSA